MVGEDKVIELLNFPGTYEKEQYWYGIDSKKLFLENKKNKNNQWEYFNKNIIYKLNEQGYRCSSFSTIDWSNSVVIMGCSHIFGLGNATEDTIPVLIEESINTNVINMGQLGASSLFQCINAQTLIENNKIPKSIIVLWPDKYRTSYFSDDDKNNIYGIWSMYGKEKYETSKYFEEYIKSSRHVEMMDSYLRMSFKYMWQNIGVNVIEVNSSDITPIDTARDLIHWGVNTNKEVSKLMLKKLI